MQYQSTQTCLAYAAEVNGAVVGYQMVPGLETSTVVRAIADADTVAGCQLMSTQ